MFPSWVRCLPPARHHRRSCSNETTTATSGPTARAVRVLPSNGIDAIVPDLWDGRATRHRGRSGFLHPGRLLCSGLPRYSNAVDQFSSGKGTRVGAGSTKSAPRPAPPTFFGAITRRKTSVSRTRCSHSPREMLVLPPLFLFKISGFSTPALPPPLTGSPYLIMITLIHPCTFYRRPGD